MSVSASYLSSFLLPPPFLCLRETSPLRTAFVFTPFQFQARENFSFSRGERPRIVSHLHHVPSPDQSLGSGLQQIPLRPGLRVRKELFSKENIAQILRRKRGWWAGNKINGRHLGMSTISRRSLDALSQS